MLPQRRVGGKEGRFSPQKDQTGRKRQAKSDRAVGPQNDSEREKRPAMERERSCCRGENVIKYPSSWADAPRLRGIGKRIDPGFAAGGPEQSLQIQPGGGTPQGGFSRPSADSPSAPALQGHPHPPQCAHWGTFPLEGGRLGGRPSVPPLRRIQKPPLLFRMGRTLAGPQMYAAC